jgi:nucleotide-binding universal stress UspA family protein
METPAIKKVGARITLTPHSDVILLEASRLAHLLDASLTLIHTGARQIASEDYIRHAAARLNICHSQEVVWNQSDSAEALRTAARQHEVELLVCGAFEGPSINRRRFLSPLARKLTKDLPCSLLFLVHPEIGETRFRRIVAITDFSEASKISCRQAIWLAEKDQAECIYVISIHSIFMDAVAAVKGSQEKSFRTHQDDEQLLEQFLADLPCPSVSLDWRVIDAITGFAACDFAESIEADLLVLPWQHHASSRVPPLADWALRVVPCSLWLIPDLTANK